ncbi:MAG TPA: hypothetical protein VMG36_04870 [Thermoplasmata archaeon]|nr:hypothetical protein [Thermoplasmata archaeon]
MRSYVDLYFAPGDVTSLEIADRIRRATGLEFVLGPHDLLFEWETVDQFRGTLQKIHDALRGTGAFYRVETVVDDPSFVPPVAWPPPIEGGPPGHHPAY